MKKIILLLLSIIYLNSNIAYSATNKTSIFTTNSNLQSTCSISIPDISFGVINIFNPSVQRAATTANIFCSKGVAYSVYPTTGIYGNSTNAYSLQMLKNNNTSDNSCILVQLEQESSGSWNPWTNGYSAYRVTGTGTGASVSLPVSITINPASNPFYYDSSCGNNINTQSAPGVYFTTVTVSLVF